jgi:hypothetical protein
VYQTVKAEFHKAAISTPGTDWLPQSADSSKIKTMLESVDMGSRRACYVNPADRDSHL